MKQNKWIMAFLAGGAMLAAAGCEQEQSMTEVGTPGAPIVFTAATSYVNGNGTRTEYSGVVYGDDNKIERIDWVEGDKFKVNYMHGSTTESADFGVTSFDDDEYNSIASVTAVSDRLVWADGSEHHFYAMYPSHAMNEDGSLTGPELSASLPASQPQTHMQEVTVNASTGTGTYTYERYLPDMKYGYMVAYAAPSLGVSGNSVTLPFRPAVTTFEFRLRRNGSENSAKVRKFSLSSSTQALTGDFSFSITGGDERGATWGTVSVPPRTPANSVITVDFGEDGVDLPQEGASSYLDFTIFALPVDLSHLTIHIEYIDGGKRSLDLYDSKDAGGNITIWHTFTGAKKYVFTNSHVPGEDTYTYHIDNLSCEEQDGIGIIYVDVYNDDPESPAFGEGIAPVQFDTYKKNRNGDKMYVDIGKVEYSADGETGWTETLPSEPFKDPFAPTRVTSEGIRMKADASMTAFTASEKSTSTIDAGEYHTDILRSRSTVGTPDAPRDLSLYTVEGKLRPNSKRVTANCYIINASGYYKFPLVYGNAIDQTKVEGEGVNTDSYNPGNISSDEMFLKTFQNYLGEGITSPYILTDTGIGINEVEAVLVWGDREKDTDPAMVDDTASNRDLSILDEDHGYIGVHIDRNNIHQGNIMVALRKKSDRTILWSWHLWVSDLTMKAVRMSTVRKSPSVSAVRDYTDFLQYNLGWSEEGITTVTFYNRAPYYVRVTQRDTDGYHETQIFKVVERGGAVVDAAMSSGTYYQWGRKDPFLPSSGKIETAIIRRDNPVSDTGNKPYYAGPDYVGQITHADDPSLGYDVSAKALNYQQANNDGHAGQSIRFPYYYLHSGYDAQYWMGTSNNDNSSLKYNLWDAKMKAWNKDQLPVKTIYDPCPPGFVVPNYYAFLNFCSKAKSDGMPLYTTELRSNGNLMDGLAYFNVIDLNGDGVISDKDFDRGFYFRKEGHNTATVIDGDGASTVNFVEVQSGRGNGLYFPAAGYRLTGSHTWATELQSDVYEMGLEGWYWTSTLANSKLARCMLFTTHLIDVSFGTVNQNYGFYLDTYNTFKTTSGMSIRPMVDE